MTPRVLLASNCHRRDAAQIHRTVDSHAQARDGREPSPNAPAAAIEDVLFGSACV